MAAGPPLSPDQARAALATIRRRQQAPDGPAPCPCCGEDGLAITDRSARPFAEWYHLACSRCGLGASLHVPMAPPAMG